MTDTLLSPSWYRVEQLKPRVREHAHFHRHRYRGQLWYVLQDHSTGRSHLLTPAAYRVAGLMDGERTTQQIWQSVTDQLGDDGPTQDETIHLLGLLHRFDLLRCDVSPDTAELFRRHTRRTREEQLGLFANPLAIRIPLIDPDRFLERWLPWVRPLFSRTAAVIGCGVLVVALLLAVKHGSEASFGSAHELLDPRNLVILWFVYPIVKMLHELGHGFATKFWGGEVHEMGILILVLLPIPYVDASAASAFPDKRKRIVVGAAGVVVELFLASIAFFVWLAVEPGLVRSIAYNVMWIGGASALLFNGNPLLKFDGYYVLSDAIEVPNLGTRSNQYLASLVLRHLLRVDKVRDPVMAPGEKAWFVGYGLAAFAYRLVILFVIALFLSGKFFGLGVGLVIFAVGMQLVRPAIGHAKFLFTSPRLEAHRARSVANSAAVVLLLGLAVLVLPVSLLTTAEGVVWLPEDAQVRAGAGGFVERFLVDPGSIVEAGDALVLTRDETLDAEVAALAAQLRELRARYHAERRSDLVRAQITQHEMSALHAELLVARQRAGEGVIRSPAAGKFVAPRAVDLIGRFVGQGERVGYVLGASIATVRVVVPQSDVALVRERTRDVELRLRSRIGRVLSAEIRREVPAATDRLPSRALGSGGGGRVPVDPTDEDGLRTLESVFQFDLSLAEQMPPREIGARVYVRFDHGTEPLAARAYRAVKRAFLRQIGV